MGRLKAFEQRKYFNSVVSYIAKRFFGSEMVSKEDVPVTHSATVSGAACLFDMFLQSNEALRDHLVSSLTRSTIPSLNESLATLRAVIAALAQDEGQCEELT